MCFNFAYLYLDTRSCEEKIQGPLHANNNNFAPQFQFRVANENNTLVLRCRVTCQEHDAWYTPHVRIITTKDGEIYHRGSAKLFEVEYSPSDITCNTASPTRDYEFRITALNDTLNESIAMCGLLYHSRSERNFTEFCHTSSVAWITLYNQPSTTTISTTIPSEKPSQGDVETGRSFQLCTPRIPEEVSIAFIALTFVCIVIISLLLIGGVVFVCKRFGKTHHKRKVSIQPSEDGTHRHSGVYTFEDMENDSTVTLRTLARR